jgi:AraC-like DNA-binding protein/mannose-6-phosphate isomerase-like protein (cupin superfamily)
VESKRLWTITYINPDEMIAILPDDTHYDSGASGFQDPEPHSHEFYELEYVLSGSGFQNINGNEYLVRRGDAVLFDIGDIHYYYPIKEFLIINCVFSPQYWDSEINKKVLKITGSENPAVKKSIHFSGSNMLLFEDLIEKINLELKNKEPEYRIAVKGYFNVLMVMLIRAGLFKSNTKHAMIPSILGFIDSHWDTATLSSVAQKYGYNPSYLSSLFKTMVGQNITDYINRRRIHEAVKLLETTTHSVEAVSNIVGFSDKKHFYHLFRHYIGTTPRQLTKYPEAASKPPKR